MSDAMTFDEWFEQNFMFDDEEDNSRDDIYFAAKSAWEASRENLRIWDL